MSTCLDCYREYDEKCPECGVGYCAEHLEVDKQAGLDDLDIVAMDKDRTTFGPFAADDIVVDDMSLRGIAATVSPPDFFDNKDNWGL